MTNKLRKFIRLDTPDHDSVPVDGIPSDTQPVYVAIDEIVAVRRVRTGLTSQNWWVTNVYIQGGGSSGLVAWADMHRSVDEIMATIAELQNDTTGS